MKKIFALMFMLASFAYVYGQPTLTSAFNPQPGDQWKYNPVNTQIEPGDAGAGVTWDFSGIEIIYNPVIENYMSPAATPYATDFPQATVAYESKQAVGTFVYYKGTGTNLERLGEASVMMKIRYLPPPVLYTYPFTFGTSVTGYYEDTATVGALELTRTLDYSANGDAYGTLRLPTGDHQDVLRIKIESTLENEYTGGVGVQTVEAVEYLWVDPASRIPLMRMIKEVHYAAGAPLDSIRSILVSDLVSGISAPASFLTSQEIHPNPATDMATVHFNLTQHANVVVDVYSVDGKRVVTGKPTPYPAGSHQEQIPLHALKAGVYIVRLTSDDTSQTVRLVKR